MIQVRFVFASEEYPEFVNKGFGDVFGVFVNGVNYARVPGTDNYIAGSGEVISIDTVNHLKHSDFFIDNAFRPAAPYGPLNIEYDGLTTAITLTIPVVAAALNEMVLVIADVRDRLLDSAVFVQAGSLRAPLETVDVPIGEGLRQTFTETIAEVESVLQTAGVAEQHIAIHQAFLTEFLKQLGVPLVGGFLVIPVDPVDYTLLTPDGKTITNTTSNVAAEISNAFYTRVGTDELLVIPNAALGEYAVQLTGVGTGEFRFGASYVEPGGNVTTRLWQGNLASDSRAFVLDFRDLTGNLQATTFALASTPGGPTGGGNNGGGSNAGNSTGGSDGGSNNGGVGGGNGGGSEGGSSGGSGVASRSASNTSLGGVTFALASMGQLRSTSAVSSTSNATAAGESSDGGGSGAGGSAGGGGDAASDLALSADTGSGGEVREARGCTVDAVSRFLDELLREMGIRIEDVGEEESATIWRTILRDPLADPLALALLGATPRQRVRTKLACAAVE